MGRGQSRVFILSWALPVITLLALLGTPTAVHAAGVSQIKLCVNPSGLTRVPGANETCRPSEKLVQWDVSGSQDTSGSQGGATTVIDSAGKTVGPLIDRDAVVLTIGRDHFHVYVGPQGFRNNSSVSLYYDVANCAGVQLIDPSPSYFLFPRLWVAGTTGYYAGTDTAGTYPIVSRKDYDMFGQFIQCYNPNPPYASRQLTPAKTVNLNPLFMPPFSIK